MAHLRMTAHFDAPIEHVFELGTDFKRYPEWNVSFTEIKEITGPADKVGTRVHSSGTLLGRSTDNWGEVVEVDRPRLFKMTGTGALGGAVTLVYRLTPVGSGTDLVIEADYDLPAGFVGEIADKLFVERAVERDIQHSIENFKAFVEMKVPVPA